MSVIIKTEDIFIKIVAHTNNSIFYELRLGKQ